MSRYDAIIIGSGQGGNPLAHKLADAGEHVALIERDHLGGSCINFGCTPTKTMIASGRVAATIREAAAYGIHTSDPSINMAEVVARKNKIVKQWRDGQQAQVDKRSSLDLFRGSARFVGPHSVVVDDETLESDRIFIDTGTRARVPEIDGLDKTDPDRILTNKSILDLTEIPDQLIVLGGSYIGLEFGQLFRRLGSGVTVVERNERIIAREDADITDALQDALESEGMKFFTGARVKSFMHRQPSSDAGASLPIVLAIDDSRGNEIELEASHVLLAVGRTPNTDDLDLEAAGVTTDDHGYIEVNDRLETTVPGIWALGDVKGGPAFTHISYDDHLVILNNLQGTERDDASTDSIEGRIVPYALYTEPELGRVGLTEAQAREAGHRLKVGSIPMSHVARAVESGQTAGLMKVVIDADTDQILGAAILGPHGGELVQTLMTLMLVDAPWTKLKRAVFIHPTLTEGFFGLMESVS